MKIPYSFYREARKDIYKTMTKIYGTEIREGDKFYKGLERVEAFFLGRKNYEKHNTESLNKALYNLIFPVSVFKKLFKRSKK